MSLEEDVTQAVTAAEKQAQSREIIDMADRGGLLLARLWHNLKACDVPEYQANALIMQAGEAWWHSRLCHGTFCGDGEDE